MVKLSPKKLLLFGKKIGQEVSSQVKNYGLHNSLGGLTSKIGKGGHQEKKGDTLSEQLLFAAIKKNISIFSLSEVVLVSEETGVKLFKGNKIGAKIFLIVDPIDGSNNLRPDKTPAPYVALSIAVGNLANLGKLKNFDAIEVAYICDIFHEDFWIAQKNKGAYFFHQGHKFKLKTSIETNLSQVILGTSLDRVGKKFDKIHKKILPLLRATFCQRRIGSTILDLTRVASGDYDAYVSLSKGVKIHDLAAVQLLIKEAKGKLIFNEVEGVVTKGSFLRELLLNKNNEILEKTGFQVIAAGNQNLANKLLKLVKF